MTQKNIQVTGGGVKSEFLKFRGQWLLKAIHITIYIKICHICYGKRQVRERHEIIIILVQRQVTPRWADYPVWRT